MTSRDFIFWLRGYIKGLPGYIKELQPVLDQLETVDDSYIPSKKDEEDNWNIYNRTTKVKDILHD